MSVNNTGNGKPPEQPHRPLGAQGDGNAEPSSGHASARPTGQTLPPPGEMQAQRVRNASVCGPRFRHNQVRARVNGNCAAPGQPDFLYNPMGAQFNGKAGQFGQPFLPFNPMNAQLGRNAVPSGQPFLPYAPMNAQLNAKAGAFGPPFFLNASMSAQLNANAGASGQPSLPFVNMTAQENGNNIPFAQPGPSCGNMTAQENGNNIPFAQPGPSCGNMTAQENGNNIPFAQPGPSCGNMTAQENGNNIPFAQPGPSYGNVLKEQYLLEYQTQAIHQKCVVMDQSETNPPQEKFQQEKKNAELAFENAELRKECSNLQLLVNKIDHAYQQIKMELECLKEEQRRNNNGEVENLKDENQTQDNHEENTCSTESPKKEDDKMMEINELKLMLESMREDNSKLSWQLTTSQSHINLLQQRLGENPVHIANELQEGEKTLKRLLDTLKKHKEMIECQENFLQQRASELNEQELKNEKLDGRIMYLEMEIRQKDQIIRKNKKKIQLLQEEIKYLSVLSAPASQKDMIDAIIKLSFPIEPSEGGAVGGAPAAPSEEGAVGSEGADTVPEHNVVRLEQELPVTEEETSDKTPQENQNEYPYKLNIRHEDWI